MIPIYYTESLVEQEKIVRALHALGYYYEHPDLDPDGMWTQWCDGLPNVAKSYPLMYLSTHSNTLSAMQPGNGKAVLEKARLCDKATQYTPCNSMQHFLFMAKRRISILNA